MVYNFQKSHTEHFYRGAGTFQEAIPNTRHIFWCPNGEAIPRTQAKVPVQGTSLSSGGMIHWRGSWGKSTKFNVVSLHFSCCTWIWGIWTSFYMFSSIFFSFSTKCLIIFSQFYFSIALLFFFGSKVLGIFHEIGRLFTFLWCELEIFFSKTVDLKNGVCWRCTGGSSAFYIGIITF